VFVKVYAVVFLVVFVIIISGCTSYTGDVTAEGEEIPEDEINNYIETTDQQAPTEQENPCEKMDCGTTTEKCDDGFNASCENKCNEGVCQTCVPDCIGHETKTIQINESTTTANTTSPNQTFNETDECEGIVCENNSLICPDDFTATCDNTCQDGICSICLPDCSGHDAIKIIFTQVYYDTSGTESDEEWIELYNPLQRAINLTGWAISDNSGSWYFPESSISGESYFIVARDETGFKSLYANCDPDISSFTRGLNNDGDQLTLKDANGKEIDFVAWEGGANGAYTNWTLQTNDTQSIKRTNMEDTDSPSDWVLAEAVPEKCG
jgi:hypothetical protein